MHECVVPPSIRERVVWVQTDSAEALAKWGNHACRRARNNPAAR